MTDLEMIYATYGEEGLDDKMDLLFDHVGDLLFEGDPVWGPLRGTAPAKDGFQRVDAILNHVDVELLSTTLIVGYLSITRTARLEGALPSSAAFMTRVEASLERRCPERKDALLKRLR